MKKTIDPEAPRRNQTAAESIRIGSRDAFPFGYIDSDGVYFMAFSKIDR